MMILVSTNRGPSSLSYIYSLWNIVYIPSLSLLNNLIYFSN